MELEPFVFRCSGALVAARERVDAQADAVRSEWLESSPRASDGNPPGSETGSGADRS